MPRIVDTHRLANKPHDRGGREPGNNHVAKPSKSCEPAYVTPDRRTLAAHPVLRACAAAD